MGLEPEFVDLLCMIGQGHNCCRYHRQDSIADELIAEYGLTDPHVVERERQEQARRDRQRE